MDQAEASGKTVEDALNRALAKLGASRDEVEFVVLDEGRKGGLFGRGAKEALVRVDRVAGASAAPRSDGPPDTRMPRGNQQSGGRGRGQGAGQGAPARGPRPAADRPERANDRGERGARTRSGGASQTRTGFDSAVPKLTDADFLRAPRYDDAGPPAPDATPVEGGGRPRGRGRRGGGGGATGNADAPAAANDAPREAREPREQRPREDRGERRRREDEPQIAPDINAEEVDFAAQTVDDILRILEIDAELSIREPLTAGDGLGAALAVIDIKGEDLGLLIGRRGDTLLSLQYLVNLILSKKYPGKGGVTIDVEHYRHRREEQVVSLARRMADRVRETGSPITLEPMSASERRLVHLLFAEDSELETNSIGEGENRKVVISSRR
jgi:spoIIIJ-associated protein